VTVATGISDDPSARRRTNAQPGGPPWRHPPGRSTAFQAPSAKWRLRRCSRHLGRCC